MRKLLLASVFAALPLTAMAAPTELINFNGGLPLNFSATNPSAGVTDLSIANVTVTFTLFGSAVTSGIMNLSAANIDAATSPGGIIVQHFSGTFEITSGLNGSGTNYLSGTFTDAALGAAGGDGLTVNVANPPEALTLSSSVIPTADLAPPSAFDLSMSAVNPPLNTTGGTIAAFTASFTGDASATPAAVPEPASIALLGAGLLGLGFFRRKRT